MMQALRSLVLISERTGQDMGMLFLPLSFENLPYLSVDLFTLLNKKQLLSKAAGEMKLKNQSYCPSVKGNNLFWWLKGRRYRRVCEIKEALNNGAFVKPYESEIMRLNQYGSQFCVGSCSHEVLPLAVNEGAQSQATSPGRRKVSHIYPPVALGLFLTPQQKPAGTHLRLWNQIVSSLGGLESFLSGKLIFHYTYS